MVFFNKPESSGRSSSRNCKRNPRACSAGVSLRKGRSPFIRARRARLRVRSLSPWRKIVLSGFALCSEVVNRTLVMKNLVEFWHVGDDGLSQRLADRVERVFKQSPDFILSSGKKPGTLVVLVPTNVIWQKGLLQNKVLYIVEFKTINDKEIGASKGSC